MQYSDIREQSKTSLGLWIVYGIGSLFLVTCLLALFYGLCKLNAPINLDKHAPISKTQAIPKPRSVVKASNNQASKIPAQEFKKVQRQIQRVFIIVDREHNVAHKLVWTAKEKM